MLNVGTYVIVTNDVFLNNKKKFSYLSLNCLKQSMYAVITYILQYIFLI